LHLALKKRAKLKRSYSKPRGKQLIYLLFHRRFSKLARGGNLEYPSLVHAAARRTITKEVSKLTESTAIDRQITPDFSPRKARNVLHESQRVYRGGKIAQPFDARRSVISAICAATTTAKRGSASRKKRTSSKWIVDMRETCVAAARGNNDFFQKRREREGRAQNEREVAPFASASNNKIASTGVTIIHSSRRANNDLSECVLTAEDRSALRLQRDPMLASVVSLSKRLNDELFAMLRINSRGQIGV